MKIEKVTLKRDAKCRWTMKRHGGGHELKKGEEVIKIHDFASNGNLVTLYFCKEHAKQLSEEIGLMV